MEGEPEKMSSPPSESGGQNEDGNAEATGNSSLEIASRESVKTEGAAKDMEKAGTGSQQVGDGDIVHDVSPLPSKKSLEIGEVFAVHEVLEHFLSVCPVECLAKFRKVNKEWNEAACMAWRQTARVVIVEYLNKPRKPIFKRFANLCDFIALLDTPDDPLKLGVDKNYQYRNYKLDAWYLTMSNPNMIKFWDNFGTTISTLELYKTRVDRMDTILQVLYTKLPNIRSLILDGLFVQKGREVGTIDFSSIPGNQNLKALKVRKLIHFPVNWVEFFRHFPKLESLESFNVKSDLDLDVIVAAIEVVRNESSELVPLKNLAIIRADDKHKCVQNPVNLQIRNSLRQCDLPLETLQVKLGCKNSCGTVMDVILGSVGGLKKLVYHIDYKCKHLSHIFPHMREFPILEELELYHWCVPETELDKLLRSMPKLKRLKFDGLKNLFGRPIDYYQSFVKTYNHETANIKNSGPASVLDEFYFPKWPLNAIKLRYLSLLAPNLTKLELKVDDKMFAGVCESYPNLIEMRVAGNKLTDAGITGIYSGTGNPQKTSIVKLKRLRVFIMRSINHALTDKSVFNGFLKVSSLFTLQIALRKDQFGQEAMVALQKQIAIVEVLPANVVLTESTD